MPSRVTAKTRKLKRGGGAGPLHGNTYGSRSNLNRKWEKEREAKQKIANAAAANKYNKMPIEDKVKYIIGDIDLTKKTALLEIVQYKKLNDDLKLVNYIFDKYVTPDMINVVDEKGFTPLMRAISLGHFSLVDKILNKTKFPNLDTTLKDSINGGTCLHIVVRMYFEQQRPAILLSIIEKLKEINPTLIDITNNKGLKPYDTILIYLSDYQISNLPIAVIDRYIKSKIDLTNKETLIFNIIDAKPMYWDATRGDYARYFSLTAQDMFLSYAFDKYVTPDMINFTRANGVTPLMQAISLHQFSLITKILNKKKFPNLKTNIQDNNGDTCLHYAAKMHRMFIDTTYGRDEKAKSDGRPRTNEVAEDIRSYKMIIEELIDRNPILPDIKNNKGLGPGNPKIATNEIHDIIKAGKSTVFTKRRNTNLNIPKNT